MPNTYTLIASNTVGGAGASSITFSSIPQTGYTDLVVKWSGRDNHPGATANDCAINFNGSGTSFTGKRIYGNGTSALSDTVAPYAGSDTAAVATASTFSNNEIYIPNYAGSTNKSFSLDSVTERNATEAYQLLYAGLWSNTAAITSISILAPSTYSFVQYSTFYLYGISKS